MPQERSYGTHKILSFVSDVQRQYSLTRLSSHDTEEAPSSRLHTQLAFCIIETSQSKMLIAHQTFFSNPQTHQVYCSPIMHFTMSLIFLRKTLLNL